MEAKKNSIALMAICLLVMVAAGMLGGFGFVPDLSLTGEAMAARAQYSWLSWSALALAYVGSAIFLVPIAFGAALILARQSRWRDLTAFVAITMGGRLLVELIKLTVGRPRPSFEPYPVPVSSLSFPSGHAGNSMLTLLALALILAPPQWRRPAVVAAVIGSMLVGISRPVVGVHWPTDVLGGWMLGIGWTTACLLWFRRERSAA
jgi:undecaprenyl-diphosphatase